MSALVAALANLVENAVLLQAFLSSFPRPPAGAVDAPEDIELQWEAVVDPA